MQEFQHKDLTDKIINAAYVVHNALGCGFLEKVYENALLVELKSSGLAAESQKGVVVSYKGIIVGEYAADIFVEDAVIVELKAVEKLSDIHELQLKNYLKATGVEIGLLLNFGKSVEVRRKYMQRGF